MASYVYKYESNGIPVYIGITDNMKRRVSQHKNDKLKVINNPKIQFIKVENRADAEAMETYLISKYDTGSYFNVSKTKKGKAAYFDSIFDNIPWSDYNENTDEDIDIFRLDLAHTVQTVYRDRVIERQKGFSFDKQQQEKHECIEYLEEEAREERKIIPMLEDLLLNPPSNKVVCPGHLLEKGICLHKKRLNALERAIYVVRKSLRPYRGSELKEMQRELATLPFVLEDIIDAINEHEAHVRLIMAEKREQNNK